MGRNSEAENHCAQNGSHKKARDHHWSIGNTLSRKEEQQADSPQDDVKTDTEQKQFHNVLTQFLDGTRDRRFGRHPACTDIHDMRPLVLKMSKGNRKERHTRGYCDKQPVSCGLAAPKRKKNRCSECSAVKQQESKVAQ